MKYFIAASVCLAFFCSCKDTSDKTKTTTTTATAATDDGPTAVAFAGSPAETPSEIPTDSIIGIYKGDFGGSPIFITINFAGGKHVAGYNVHKGLRRNLSGTIKHTDNEWLVEMSEPGDHSFDGKFRLKFNEALTSASGTWTPSNTPTTLKEKQFRIERQINPLSNDFEYGMEYLYADHADISFKNDGSVVFNYYDKINDSTFAQQMNTVRGTWDKKDNVITVNWQKNEKWGKTSSSFNIHTNKTEDGDPYPPEVFGEGYEFSTPL